ncbi:protein myomaker isoform X3 [Bos javanicus]|uniref:protein myomaker isoform X3 n=1 Tax=Bos javanicus TaxID=9906 RepID=UPI002AA681D3|nr:protein myomaker isoform X3 [Bos javanicus]
MGTLMAKLLLPTISSLAFLPTVSIAAKRRFHMEAMVYLFTTFFLAWSPASGPALTPQHTPSVPALTEAQLPEAACSGEVSDPELCARGGLPPAPGSLLPQQQPLPACSQHLVNSHFPPPSQDPGLGEGQKVCPAGGRLGPGRQGPSLQGQGPAARERSRGLVLQEPTIDPAQETMVTAGTPRLPAGVSWPCSCLLGPLQRPAPPAPPALPRPAPPEGQGQLPP